MTTEIPPSHKIAVVTGAARGLGQAVGTILADEDTVVLLVDQSPDVHRVAKEIGALGKEARGYVVDLADGKQISALTQSITSEFGRCDILVNNAGLSPKAPDGGRLDVADIPIEQWERVLAVNLTAAFRLTAWALPLMKKQQWGRIINMSSRAGRMYVPQAGAHYSATKAALIGFTRAVAGEGGPFGVTANCVAPGRIATPMTTTDQVSDALESAFRAATPIGRVGTPEEVAGAVKYLVSDAAAFVTGSVLDINGGVYG